MRGRELLFVILGNALLTVVTLGMGAAWANVNMARFWCEATTLENFGGFDARQRTMAATATGESVASILEIDGDAGAFGI